MRLLGEEAAGRAVAGDERVSVEQRHTSPASAPTSPATGDRKYASSSQRGARQSASRNRIHSPCARAAPALRACAGDRSPVAGITATPPRATASPELSARMSSSPRVRSSTRSASIAACARVLVAGKRHDHGDLRPAHGQSLAWPGRAVRSPARSPRHGQIRSRAAPVASRRVPQPGSRARPAHASAAAGRQRPTTAERRP